MKKHNSNKVVVVAGLALAAALGNYFVYGKNAKGHRAKVSGWALKAKGEVLDQIEKTKDLNQKHYHKIIDQVTKRYSKLKSVDLKDVKVLGDELKKHWRNIEREFKTVAKKTKTVAKRKGRQVKQSLKK